MGLGGRGGHLDAGKRGVALLGHRDYFLCWSLEFFSLGLRGAYALECDELRCHCTQHGQAVCSVPPEFSVQ